MRKRLFGFAALIILLITSSSAFAQAPQIPSGLTWLYSSQTPTGNWPEVVTTDYYSTAASLDSISALDPSNPAYTSGFQWLSTQLVSPTDYTSRQIIALKRAGQDTSSYLASLLLYRNSDGGFGGAEDCPNSYILDTALALQALKAANYTDDSVLYHAVLFLINNQNADGGWEFTPSAGMGSDSNVYVTAHVLKILPSYVNYNCSARSVVDKGVAFLLSHQNPDGGFGSSPSTIYESALAFDALIATGANISTIDPLTELTPAQAAINYLTTAQLADGSWNDDPYSTALALQALARIRPNLTASSLTLSKPMPQEGKQITITATIKNTGLDAASNIIVRFYLGDPSAGGTQIGVDQVISTLSVGGSAQASVNASFTGTGGKTIFALVDPDNLISETSETDNKVSARLWIATGPDLAVYSEDLKPSTYVPTAGTPFTLEYTVRNLGETTAPEFDIAVYDGQPSGAPLQTAHLSGIEGSGIRTGTIGVTLTGNGPHTLYLTADPGTLVPELNEANNTGSVTVTIGGTLTQADLAITPADIILNPSRPRAGDTVQISANVRNIGADSANNFTVGVYDGAPETGGTLINSQSISLVAGGSQTITANWPIPSGIHDVYVILDRANVVIESDESNNRASVRVMTDMVDIALSATDLVFTPSHPVANDAVALTITVRNTGIKDTGSFNFALYDGDPNAGGVLLQTYLVSTIPGDGSQSLTYAFTAMPRTYRFYAVADSENVVAEMYEDNNQAIRSLRIKAPGETLGPDLAPIKIDLTDTTTDPQTLAISGTAHVTLQNIGDDKVTTPFNVLIFEDKDYDGRYTSGVDTLLGTGSNTLTLWPEGANMIDVPLTGTVTFLHSPLYAYVDSGDAILEQDETNNLLISCNGCEVVPSNPIQPKLKWKFPLQGITYKTPVVTHLTDDNGDGKIDENDVPSLVFITMTGYPFYGKLWAVRGDTGQTIFTVNNPTTDPISSGSSVTVGDIDNDGLPEIIVEKISSNGGYIAYDHTGARKWDNSSLIDAWNVAHPTNRINVLYTLPSIADLDGDGATEIVAGATVFNADGSVRCSHSEMYAGKGSTGIWTASSVADIDMDGRQEIIAGNTVYNNDCTIKWSHASIADGLTAVANLDDDAYPEIVLLDKTDVYGGQTYTKLYLFDHLGNIVWGPVYYYKDLEPGSPMGHFSQPVIADFDGDGKPEIGVMGWNKYYILDRYGVVKKTLSIPAKTVGHMSAPTVFDLNGDGKPEVMIVSDYNFRIFDGKTGAQLYSDTFGGTGNNPQNVIIADVDGDSHAEVVAIGMDPYKIDGMRVYGSDIQSGATPWTNARPIWNQHSYHVTNINDDGSIPQHEAPSWLLNNTYLTQAAIGANPNPYLTPNLTASYLRVEQAGTSVNLAVRVGNGGAIASPASVTVTYYDGDPAAGGIVIGTASTTKTLNPGEYQDVIYSWTGGSPGIHHLYAVVDAANAISECRKDDNQAEVDYTIVVEYSDLKIGQEDITLPAGPYYEGTPVPVTVNVKNIGGLSASNITVRMYNGNPASGGVQIGSDQIIPAISVGGSIPLVFSFDTLGKAGTNVLYFVVDPSNAVVEISKANNSASAALSVKPPVLPDLAVATSDLVVTPASPSEGNTITATATIHNQGAATSNIPVNFYLGSPASGGTLIGSQTIYPVLALGGAATVQASFNATGWAGQQQVYVVVDPANTIAETKKDNNSASQSFFVQSAGLSSSMSLDKPTYPANDTVTSVITAVNTASNARSLSLSLTVLDASGNLIATISSNDPVTVGPNSSAALTRTWNTGKTLAGAYTMTGALSESGSVVSRTSSGFGITADKTLSAKVTADKISYNPNENAALTAVVTSQSQNYIYQNLTALITVTDQKGNVLFTDTRSVTNLMPGAAFTIKDNWSVGSSPAGPYTAACTVQDGSKIIVGTSLTAFAVIGTSASGTGLTGAVTASAAAVKQNSNEILTYSITNNGNEDVTNLAVNVIIVNPGTQAALQTYPSTASIPLGQSATGSATSPTGALLPGTYLAVLQAATPAMAQPRTLAGATFTVLDGIPPVVTIVSPAPKGVYNGTLTISALATDNFSGVDTVQFQIDGGAWHPLPLADPAQGLYASTWTPAPNDNSVHTANFMATDKAANASAPVGISFTIDTQPPTLTLSTLPDGSYTNNATLNIAGKATDNVAVQGVTINGTPVTLNPDGTFSGVVLLASGPNAIATVATDTAGNSAKDSRTITLDQAAPVITITSPADNSVTNNSSPTVTGAVDKPASVTVKVNGGSPVAADLSGNSFSLPILLIYGQNTIEVSATDLATNTATAKRSVVYDNVSPSLAVTNPAEDITTNQPGILLEGTVADLTGITVTIAFEGATYTPVVTAGAFQQDLAFSVPKTYAISVTATDAAGNMTTVQRNVIYNAGCPSQVQSNFNGTAISGGNTVWFNGVAAVTGRNTAQKAVVYLNNATVLFSANNQTDALNIPDSKIIFSPTASSATTVFENGTWVTTIPAGYTGNVFLSGLAYHVPAAGLPGGINPVTWSGDFMTDSAGLSVQWKWAAAVYTNFSADTAGVQVKPVDDNSISAFQNSDHAGTPENYKTYVIGGARGGGGSNYTGSYSGTTSISLQGCVITSP